MQCTAKLCCCYTLDVLLKNSMHLSTFINCHHSNQPPPLHFVQLHLLQLRHA
jgi:hypothetical protein